MWRSVRAATAVRHYSTPAAAVARWLGHLRHIQSAKHRQQQQQKHPFNGPFPGLPG